MFIVNKFSVPFGILYLMISSQTIAAENRLPQDTKAEITQNKNLSKIERLIKEASFVRAEQVTCKISDSEKQIYGETHLDCRIYYKEGQGETRPNYYMRQVKKSIYDIANAIYNSKNPSSFQIIGFLYLPQVSGYMSIGNYMYSKPYDVFESLPSQVP